MKKDIVLIWLFHKMRKHIPAMIIMVLCNIGRGLLDVAFALGSKQVIDAAVSGEKTSFYEACIRQGFIIVGLLFCLAMFRFLKEQLQARMDRDWKRHLLHSLLHSEYAEVSAFHSGELINRMTNDVRIVNEGLLISLPNLVTMVTRLGAVATVLIGMAPIFTFTLLVFGAVVMLITGFMRRSLKNLNKKVSAADGKVSGMLQEIMEKMLIVQAMDVGAEVEARTDILMKDRYCIQMKKKNVGIFTGTAVNGMSHAIGFAALLYGAGGLLNGTMGYGSLTALIQLVGQLQSPFVNMSGVYPQYIAMLASAERLKELCDLNDQEGIYAPVGKSSESADHVDVEEVYRYMDGLGGANISFTYDQNPVFTDAEFMLPKRAFAVITGSSGIGKSTLLKLLLGIYRPEKGRFFLQCKDGEMPLTRDLRSIFAYVPQGNLLLSGTIRENLLLMNPTATEEELSTAIYVSAMDGYLGELPLGLDTPLTENAGGLSEGQAQRLAIARAIIKGTPILLLDEATSALDAETEMLVLSRLQALQDRTCLIVTHRPAAIALCDWELKIEGMKIHTIPRKDIWL